MTQGGGSVLRFPRGVLVIRIVVSGNPVYLLEIQRRLIWRQDENGASREVEEPLKGFVFVLEHETDLKGWLRDLLIAIPVINGVMQQLIGACPGTAHVFKHAGVNTEEVPCEAAVRNGLKKAGVEL
ncbi:MAG: hypothetical protein AB7T14_08500 [Candidatus Methylacidiphilaceae bacterium]